MNCFRFELINVQCNNTPCNIQEKVLVVFNICVWDYMVMQNGTMMNQNNGLPIIKKVLIFTFLVYLLVVGFFLGIRYQQNKDSEAFNSLIKEANKEKEIVYVYQDNQNNSSEPAPQEGTLETHTSKKLGISFKYFQYEKALSPIKVKETEDKVHLYINYLPNEPDDPIGGNYLEVFTKDPNISLEKAVSEKFLIGYSKDDCEVVPKRLSQDYIRYTPEFEYVYINVPGINPDDTLAVKQEKTNRCPVGYTYFNSISYFVMDKKHPDKYAFVNIGQSSFLSYPGIGWYLTLQFND